MGSIAHLIRPNIRDLSPYTSAREQFIDYGLTLLDANENPRGSVGVEDNDLLLHRYPDPYQRQLKAVLSKIWEHPLEGMVLGNGSDEIIDLLIRIFCEPGIDEVIVTAPTYGMYKVAAHINNVQVTEVSLRDDFDLDAEALLKEVRPETKMIFLCSPNNPTGNLLAKAQIMKVLQTFKGIVVLDEAYIDFAQSTSFISQCQSFPNLVVTQTFSKAWGLAGIRLGVCYTSPEIVQYLNKAKPPYNVNQLTQHQALKALDSIDDMKEMVARILKDKKKLIEDLKKLTFVEEIFPSDTNFILVRIHRAAHIFKQLITKRVIVRNRSTVHLCEGCLRITVGTTKENQLLIEAMQNLKL